jgi:flavin reductase (DIM6/NTAB) family NADH-FMN oxidoreductase RutF
MAAHPDGGTRLGARETLRRLVLGPVPYPHQCAIGLSAPQSEISVWLQGIGRPRDVTSTNFIAGTEPLMIGIGMGTAESQAVVTHPRPVLVFREQNAGQRILGKISLQWTDALSLGPSQLHLFRVVHSANYCSPRPRRWARNLYYAYQRWHSGGRSNSSDIRISHRERGCLFTFYVCPRPVVLVSVMDGDAKNIFPMDLIGDFSDRHFSLALHATSGPVSLLEKSRRIALSDVPIEQTQLAYALGKNHTRASVDWSEIGFATTSSPSFRLPVPQFALRVRDMQIEAVRSTGGHKLFLARTIADQRFSSSPQLHLIHGLYQSWRQRSRTQV